SRACCVRSRSRWTCAATATAPPPPAPRRCGGSAPPPSSPTRCRAGRRGARCEAVLEDPARHATLAGWARDTGASARTITRLFRSELGTSFGQWRQQVLLARALSLAARRQPVGRIASELGYASPSAFTAMVRRSVGQPPRRFFL